MRSILGSSIKESSGASSVKYFEIRLDQSNIILRGNCEEAASALLKGTLVLCLSEPLRIQAVRLRFTGEKRIGWLQSGSSGPSNLARHEEFMRHTWEFKRSSETLQPGNYEWPFHKILSGETAESLEGLSDTWIIYRMKAAIERGMLQQNSIARKQVRIIRTLDPGSLELSHAMAIENTWPNKLEYSISTPTKAIIFGSNIRIDFKLVPLLKGLKIGKVTTRLSEKQEMFIHNPRTHIKSRLFEREITRDAHRLREDAETEDINGQEGYLFSRSLEFPQSLKKCVQTMEALGIKIRHKLSFEIQLKNPDGHISELLATLPLYVFLSPNLPINDNNDLIKQDPTGAIAATALDDLTPPQYGEHRFDRLYSEIDPTGYMTPPGAASGMNTPLQPRSRSVSTENLASMDAMASSGFAASVLLSRLNNLDIAGTHRTALDRSPLSSAGETAAEHNVLETMHPSDTVHPQHESVAHDSYYGYISSSTSQHSEGVPVSRRPSDEDPTRSGLTTPQHIECSDETLKKVPSYSTALQSNSRIPINNGLPTYQHATRMPIPSSPMHQTPGHTYAHVNHSNRPVN